MNKLLLIALICSAERAAAVTVSIQVVTQPTCTYSTGVLQAVATGGVGPYSYLWSTGATTASIGLVPAGFYSVTVTDANLEEASDQLNVAGINFSSDMLGFDPLGDAWCDQFIIPQPFMRWIPHPVMTAPYSFNGVEPLWDPYTAPDPMYYVGIPGSPGQIVTMNFTDGTGCTGTTQVIAGYEVEWPLVTVMQVNGACAGGANGSVDVAFGPEGHGYSVSAEIRNMQDQIVAQGAYDWYGMSVFYKTYTGLAPGTYRIVQHLSFQNPGNYYSMCSDETFFTIPDLGPTCGQVNGLIYVDGNFNCTKQSNEPMVPNALLEVQPGPYYITSNAEGGYSANLPLGSYTIAQVSTQFEEHCANAPQPFTITGTPAAVSVNFPDSSLVPLDVSVTIASGAARPGFQVQYGLQVSNHTPTNSGSTQLVMTFDPAVTFVSAFPTPTSVVGNVIMWNQAQLNAWQLRQYTVILQVPPDIGLLGTVLNADATIITANTDAAPANNSYTHAVTITGAYDPNDKLAVTSSHYSDEVYYIGTDEWIDYTIRFQNTGTDTAFNVVITDTLPTTLDPATLVIGAGSHPFTWELRDQGVLKLYFMNIQLPDSNVNEPASHGFVGFRIRPHLPLLPGDEIVNIANIYFDFNPPVITEPSVLVGTMGTGVAEERSVPQLLLSPNPTGGLMQVQVNGERSSEGLLRVLAMDGRVVVEQRMNGPWTELDLSWLSPTMYLLEWNGSHGARAVLPFIRQ
jgi:uncharacterized repeat protein (TIGR01451 family)